MYKVTFLLMLTFEEVIFPSYIFSYLISLVFTSKIKRKNPEFKFFALQDVQPKENRGRREGAL